MLISIDTDKERIIKSSCIMQFITVSLLRNMSKPKVTYSINYNMFPTSKQLCYDL